MRRQGHQSHQEVTLLGLYAEGGANRRIGLETIRMQVGQFLVARIGQVLASVPLEAQASRCNDVVSRRIGQPGKPGDGAGIVLPENERRGAGHSGGWADDDGGTSHYVDRFGQAQPDSQLQRLGGLAPQSRQTRAAARRQVVAPADFVQQVLEALLLSSDQLNVMARLSQVCDDVFKQVEMGRMPQIEQNSHDAGSVRFVARVKHC